MKYLTDYFSSWVTGCKKEGFESPGGDILFHFNVREPRYILINIVLWADSEQHVLEIVESALKHVENCEKRFQKNTNSSSAIGNQKLEKCSKIREHISNDNYLIQEVPKNRVLNVSWAGNDTFR